MAVLRAQTGITNKAHGVLVVDNVKSASLKRWDGVGRTWTDWDNLRRDPDIWERNGNCLVYLYGKGESRRGPSFKLPLSALLAARCHPLIQRFLVLDGVCLQTPQHIERWNHLHPRRTVELYMPAPPLANATQALHYHLATRNFFAWVLGRPMVAEHLGSALVGLLHSLNEHRCGHDTNVEDLMVYMRYAGYLHLAEAPDYALAILHLAESFKMYALYARAFAHCVGMNERLADSEEYLLTSPASRKLIRRARTNMNRKMNDASDMLKNFLDDQLSETYVGLHPGARAHLERFRSFLLSYYSSKLGYYPPESFSAGILQIMLNDFTALYELLADNGQKSFSMTSRAASGGICTLQLVQSFDAHAKLKSLEYPLPRLPQLEHQNEARRMSWLPLGEKAISNQRQLTLVALIKACNWKETAFQNDLVRAYRKFEEESIMSPSKTGKKEKVSVTDARKVRWIVIYGVYQVLRRAMERPTVVQNEQVSYHLNVCMDNLPPWMGTSELGKSATQSNAEQSNKKIISWDSGVEQRLISRMEIKPDIDYFALTHHETQAKSRSMSLTSVPDKSSAPALTRSGSVSQALRRNSTFRRSFMRFRPGSPIESQQVTQPAQPSFHEIVVQGYGNGTNDVRIDDVELSLRVKGGLASRSDSTASQATSSCSSESARGSTTSTIDSLTSAATSPSLTSPVTDEPLDMDYTCRLWGQPDSGRINRSSPDVKSATMLTSSSESSLEPTTPENDSAAPKSTDKPKDKMKRRSLEPERSAPVSTVNTHHRRYSIIPDLRRRSTGPEGRFVPVRIREDDIDEEPPCATTTTTTTKNEDSAEWAAMQAFMDGKSVKVEMEDAWGQYSDLGGLTDMR